MASGRIIKNDIQFREEVVRPDLEDFMKDKGDVRKAFHCAISLFHLADWVYASHKKQIDAKFGFIDDRGKERQVNNSAEFANALGQKYEHFQLIRGIANALKHFQLKPVPEGRVNPKDMPSHSANVFVVGGGFSNDFSDDFQKSRVHLEGAGGDRDFAALAKSTMQMWDDLIRTEGWE